MLNIDKKNKNVLIKLDKNFYHIDLIKKAMDDYKDLGEFKIDERTSIVKIYVRPFETESLDAIGFEFCNYVFGLMKNENKI